VAVPRGVRWEKSGKVRPFWETRTDGCAKRKGDRPYTNCDTISAPVQEASGVHLLLGRFQALLSTHMIKVQAGCGHSHEDGIRAWLTYSRLRR